MEVINSELVKIKQRMFGELNETITDEKAVRAGLIFTTRGQENSYHHIAA